MESHLDGKGKLASCWSPENRKTCCFCTRASATAGEKNGRCLLLAQKPQEIFSSFLFLPLSFSFFSDGLGMFSFSFSRWKFTQITPGCWWTDESPSLLFLFHGLASTQTERNIRNLVAVWPLSLMERSRGKQLSPIWKR